MALSIGIVGLPNVGKSTVFNALTRAQKALVANYPFATIEPNRAIVPVPDERLERLTKISGRGRTIHATIEFVDIAGLVRGASKGEGLGNQFLGHIRDTAVIVHVVRCFEEPNVVHVSGELSPREDIEVVNTELILADLQQLERKIERLMGQVKGDRKTFGPLLEMAERLKDHLETGEPILTFADRDEEAFETLNQEMRFLTGKPVLYVANVDDESLTEENECVQEVRQVAGEQGADVVKLAAKLEEELAALGDEERAEYLALLGIKQTGLEQVIQKSFRALGLISFFTMNEEEVRAWTIPAGSKAPQAAAAIHTDFERGFIRAEVMPYEVFVQHGSGAAARAAGAMRVEGKEYIVHDGDLIYFRFNV